MVTPSSTFSSEESQQHGLAWRVGVVCLFVLSVLALDRAIASALSYGVAHNQTRFGRVYRGQEPASILILGNSRGADSFLADDISSAAGVPAFNLSWMGVSMRLTQVLLDDYLELNAAPRLVLVEVTSLETPPNQQLGYLMPYTSRSFGLQRYWCEQRPDECWMTQVASAFRYNSLSTIHAFLHLGRGDQSRWHSGVISPALIEDSGAADAARPYDLLPENATALRSIVETCRQRGIPLRLVMAPFFPAYLRGRAGMSDWKQRVRDLSGERLWDYSELLSAPKFFADRIHLNREGSRALLEQMLRDGAFQG